MRRRVARDRACALRRLDSAGRASRRLRRLARRQQGEQYRQGGAALRACRKGLQPRAVGAAPDADAVHHSLELQSFRGAGRHRRQARLSQRSRHRPPQGRSRRARSGLHRRRTRLRTRRGVQEGRQQAERHAPVAARAAQLEDGGGAADPGQHCAGRAQHRRRRLLQDLRRRHPDPALAELAGAAADRHGGDRGVPGRADDPASVAADEAAGQALGRHDQPVSLAGAGAAARILHAASCRRHREPRRRQRDDRPPAVERHRLERAEPDVGAAVCRGHGRLRCPACRRLRRHLAAQRRSAARARPAARGAQLSPRARAGQAPERDRRAWCERSRPSRQAAWRTMSSASGPDFRPRP